MVFRFLERSVSPLYNDLDGSRGGDLRDTRKKADFIREEPPSTKRVGPRGVLNPVKSQQSPYSMESFPSQISNQVDETGAGRALLLKKPSIKRPPTKPIPIPRESSSSSCWKTRNSERQQRLLLAEQDAEYRAQRMYARIVYGMMRTKKKNQSQVDYCNTMDSPSIWDSTTETRRRPGPWSPAFAATCQQVHDERIQRQEEEEEEDEGLIAVRPPWQGWPGSPPHRIDVSLPILYQGPSQDIDEFFDLSVQPTRADISLILSQGSAPQERNSLDFPREDEQEDSPFLVAGAEEQQKIPSSRQLRAMFDACTTIHEEDDDDEALFEMDDM